MSKRLQQLSVFVENKKGKLSDITTLLAKNNISISSINLSDASDFGILRLMVNDNEKAKAILDKAGISSKFTGVFAVEISDHIGSFNTVAEALSEKNINIEYTYTLSNAHIGAFIFKVKERDLNTAIDTLKDIGVNLLNKV